MTVNHVICPSCNHKMGIGPDNDLADSVAFIRNICGFKAGDGDEPPEIRGLESGGTKLDLIPGMRPRLRPKQPLDIQITDKDIRVQVNANSRQEAEKLAKGAAAKIAKQFGRKGGDVIELIAQDLLKDSTSFFSPAPSISYQAGFGQGKSQQAAAKACLVLWAKHCGNDEVNSKRYDAVRHYILTGEKTDNPEEIVKLDTRTLPDLPERFGLHPNIIWVGSDPAGQTYGYFRLYGAIGWRIALCGQDAPVSRHVCLISNPYDNRSWALLERAENPIDHDWVFAQWETWPPDYRNVQSRMALLLKYAHAKSQDDWMANLVREGLEKADCREGDIITPGHIEIFSNYIGRALTAHILKTTVPEE
ncbi:hypothetical protein GGD81_004581 [Rhodobium orientis]|nr:hypothetical protein [Rhodobium orientis]